MTHFRVEEYRTLLKGRQSILRAEEDARHGQHVCHALPAESAHVGLAKQLRQRLEIDAIVGEGDAAGLLTQAFKAVVVHQDPLLVDIDVDILDKM